MHTRDHEFRGNKTLNYYEEKLKNPVTDENVDEAIDQLYEALSNNQNETELKQVFL